MVKKSDGKRLCVSFSGGKTSAFMAKWARDHAHEHGFDEVHYVFANTGQEHEKTLEFVDRCDREWGLGVTWLEAVVHHRVGVGTTHRIVDYKHASRDGRPFREVIEFYGIPNQAFPHCTREMKLAPIKSYIKSIGWGGCSMAVGIRADEIDRMQADAREKGIVYPLIKWSPMDKAAINRFWDRQPFNLDIKPLEGNCVWCWKKHERKLVTLYRQDPSIFDFPMEMEQKHAWTAAERRSKDTLGPNGATFFRGGKNTHDIIASAKSGLADWVEGEQYDMLSEFDVPNGCSESCEVTW